MSQKLRLLPPPPKNEYISWITAAKGFGVLCVVLGHQLSYTNIPYLKTAIYSFHVPIFFILSGLVLNTHKYGVGEFILKKVKTLLIPAYFFILLFLPFDIFISRAGLSSIVQNITYYKGWTTANAPVWFFITLFEIMCVARLINLTRRNAVTRLLLAAAGFALGWLLTRFDVFYFGVNKLAIGFGFLSLGTLVPLIGRIRFSKTAKLLSVLALAAVWFVSAKLNESVTIYYSRLGKYPLFLLAALSGSALVMLFFRYLPERLLIRKWLLLLGEHSVIIICSHTSFSWVLGFFLDLVGLKQTLPGTVITVIGTLIMLFLYIPVGKFAAKYLPRLVGKQKIK